MHALKVVKPKRYTFTLYIGVVDVKALSLVDIGNTTTFMTIEIVAAKNVT
jgi:hypothetical protein